MAKPSSGMDISVVAVVMFVTGIVLLFSGINKLDPLKVVQESLGFRKPSKEGIGGKSGADNPGDPGGAHPPLIGGNPLADLVGRSPAGVTINAAGDAAQTLRDANAAQNKSPVDRLKDFLALNPSGTRNDQAPLQKAWNWITGH